MELMLNELSIEGQFYDSAPLDEAVGRVMRMRRVATQFGREIYCHRNTPYRFARQSVPLVQALSREQRGAVMLWLNRQGPFWEDRRKHDSNEYFQVNEELVTDDGLAEAAYLSTIGVDHGMVSFAPSSWEYSPIQVKWMRDDADFTRIDLKNYWDPTSLEIDLSKTELPPESWNQLEQRCRLRFGNLNFLDNSFDYLEGQPFAPGVAMHIVRRLEALDRLQSAGRGSVEGRELYNKHFTGDRAWFSDSSDTEKRDYRQKLTFPSPKPGGEPLFCTWHGKINTPPYRIHFSWPTREGDSLHVAYVGWKITVH